MGEAIIIQKKSQEEINELQRKLKWYIENQELIENLNEKIKKQHNEIYTLKTHSTSPSPQTMKKFSQTKHARASSNCYFEKEGVGFGEITCNQTSGFHRQFNIIDGQ